MGELRLFPTLLHRAGLPGGDLLSDLEAACWMIEDGDEAGHAWCEREGYPGYTSYASLDDLPTRAPAFAELVSILDDQAAQMAKALHWQLGTAHLVCDSLWINILGEGGQHSGHIHPGSVLSGTCYIAMPENAAALKFEDPRLSQMMAAPQIVPDAPEDQRRFVYMTPQAGEILMWESWLRHEVCIHRTEAPRISISFNYSVQD